MTDPRVTVVVVTHAGAVFVADCVRALAGQTLPHRLLVLDNASTDGTAALLPAALARHPDARSLRSERNLGFAGGVALALEHVTTPLVALLNDDAVAEPGWLAALVAVLDGAGGDQVAAVTSVLRRADDPATVNNAGGALTADGHGTDLLAGAPVDAVPAGVGEVFAFSGGAVLLRSAALRAVGGFPADFFLYYEDTDVAWRLRLAGWRVVRSAAARVDHRHAATSDVRSVLFHRCNERNRLRMLVRCAPAGVAAGALLRFVLTTGSLAARRVLRPGRAPLAPNLRPGLRLAVLAEVLLGLPRLLRQRRRTRLLTGAGPARRRAVWQHAAVLRGDGDHRPDAHRG